jgi:transcriptional regulator with XRE-family HTH domain
MQAQATKEFYKSGFPKVVQRGKYNLKLNERLKIARNRKGLSAQQVVKLLKKKGTSIGHSTLQGYEADENSNNHRYPSINVLKELAEFYDCSLDYLFGLTDKFKIQAINSKRTDIRDLLDSDLPLTYNGKRLTKEKRDLVATHLDVLLNK